MVFGIVGCSMPQAEKEKIAAVTCSIIIETRNMDAAVRVEKINEAREKINGEPFLRGDDVIKESIRWNLCEELVLGIYDENLQLLKDAQQERERLAWEAGAEDRKIEAKKQAEREERQRLAAKKQAERERLEKEKQRIADSKPTVVEEFDFNGKLKERVNYQSKIDGGKKHGLRELYNRGKLQIKQYYKDGKRHGLSEHYRENGQLQWIMNWKDGLQHGIYESYSESGQLKLRINWKDGKHHGLSESYFDNGKLSHKENKKDGLKHGVYERYHKNGRLILKRNFWKGKEDGLYEVYYATGRLDYKRCYKNDEKVDMSYCEN